MTINIDRSVCRDLNETIAHEWLVSNGLGGYAAGTVAGVLTRKQHGLLVTTSPQTATPQLMLAKIDEEIHFDQRTYYLGTNEYQDGTFNPTGFVHLDSFRLEDGFPVFIYRLGGIDGLFLEKRIWMYQGQQTTFVQYRIVRTTTTERPGYRRSGITGALSALERYPEALAPLLKTQQSVTLTLLPLAAYRPHDGHQYGNLETQYTLCIHHANEDSSRTIGRPLPTIALPQGSAGCSIIASDAAQPYHILALGHPDSNVSFVPTGVWYWHFLHRHDSTPGKPSTDDFYLPGIFRATLWPGEDAVLTLVISSEELSQLPLHRDRLAEIHRESHEQRRYLVHNVLESSRFFGEGGEAAQAHAMRVLPFTTTSDPYAGGREFLSLLLLASNHFIVSTPQQSLGLSRASRPAFAEYSEPQTILPASYFGLANRTRDALIALPGLLLVPGRHEEASNILRRLTHYFLSGQLPDRLPTRGHPLVESDYRSADTTLWYFYALDYYLRTTRHYTLLEEVFPHLKGCINRYIHGTANGVQIDPSDGLLSATRAGTALTWMNAYGADGQPVTPRSGKPVELNALWYYALSLMHEWSQYLSHMGMFGHSPAYYEQLSSRCAESFQRRFWYEAGGYLYDVVDGPQGDDSSLRPNQLFAFSLRYPVLQPRYRSQVIEKVTQHLLTSFGLRTLAPRDAVYRGRLQPHTSRDRDEQQLALHQGSVWPWLIGPYLDALLALWSQPTEGQEQHLFQEYLWRKGLQLLEPFQERFKTNLLGMCESVLDGNAPHHATTDGQSLGSALSVGELLRCYHMLAHLRAIEPEHMHSH